MPPASHQVWGEAVTSAGSDVTTSLGGELSEMASATLFFDVVSPYAYLMDAMVRRSETPLALELKPVLFAGLLNAHGTKGPAEIPRKRLFTYEFCTWLAQCRGIPFQMPPIHPFNPIRYLRLIVGLGCKREVTSEVFDALYTMGDDPDAPSTWHRLLQRLGVANPELLIESPEVKLQLRKNTDDAVAKGVFGVPTITAGERLFWGVDSLPMFVAHLAGDPSLDTPQMQAARRVRFGAARKEPR